MPGKMPASRAPSPERRSSAMHRRDVLKGFVATGALAALAPAARAAPVGWRHFEITYTIDLATGQKLALLWVPVPQDALDYQRVVDLTWQSPVAPSVLWEEASRAPIVAAAWRNQATPRRIEIAARIVTRDRAGFSPESSPEELAEYLRPTASSPTDGIVLAKAREIIGDCTEPLDKARAIYDWIVDNTFRRGETRGCGLGNIEFMLKTGDMGGKCADINSLFVGLARAAGLPARDFFGIRVADSGVSKSLGKSGDITKAQHCRAEVYIDGKGWFPVDPADVRKVVLEEEVPLDSDKVKALRERLFGNWEMNWVGFNYARDFMLPGTQEGPIGFLMYPYAETPDGSADSLDPAHFSYTIAAREIA